MLVDLFDAQSLVPVAWRDDSEFGRAQALLVCCRKPMAVLLIWSDTM